MLRADIEWDELPANTPSDLRKLIRRCLQRDLRRRLQHVGDGRLVLEEWLEADGEEPVATTAVSRGLRFLRAAITLTVVASLAGLAAAWLLRSEGSGSRGGVVWSVVSNPPSLPYRYIPNTGSDVAISPDGRYVVYTATLDGATHLYRRPLDQLQGDVLVSGKRILSPFVSPDGEWIGYYDDDTKSLKKVSSRGGPPVKIGDMNLLNGASWGMDDTIVVGVNGPLGLLEISADGGQMRPLTTPEDESGELFHWYPQLLPGDRTVLFGISGRSNQSVAVLSLDTGEWRTVLEGVHRARYLSSGHLVYGLDGSLWAVPFDLAQSRVLGRATPVLDGILTRVGLASNFAVSQDGTLAYVAGQAPSLRIRELVWVDRQGREETLSAPLRGYETVRISPAGDRIALGLRESLKTDSWVWSVAEKRLTRLADGTDPSWTPEGDRIVFSAEPAGDLSIQKADGTGTTETLRHDSSWLGWTSVGPAGEFLVYSGDAPLDDLWVLRLDDPDSARRLIGSPGRRRNGQISPNGRWIVYESESYGQFEIYVRSFPNVEDKRWQISTQGGVMPQWSRDGRELFYRDPSSLVAVQVESDGDFRPGNQEALFDDTYYLGLSRGIAQLTHRAYDVSADGKRFLMIKGPHAAPSEPMDVVLVLNWFEELERLVPTD